MKRWKHTLSHYRMVTGNMGEIMPVQCVPVLPGDTMQGYTSALIRVSPTNLPVMHPVTVRTHTFFVPNRIVYPGWEDFITGGNDGQGEGASIPTISTTGTKKTLHTYLGCPPIPGVDVNAMPLLAANKVVNEYYRDQDLVPERGQYDASIPKCAWEKDYFSSARPWSQRGPDVTLPLGQSAPIRVGPGATANAAVGVQDADGIGRLLDSEGVNAQLRAGSSPEEEHELYADLSQAISPAVNDFRAAFALQRYQEARARYGARFTEYLRYLGVTPSDQRLQRPEFLGGGTTRLSFSEVLQTAPTSGRDEGGIEGTGVGDLYGHGIAGLRTGRWRKFFEEHGYVITMLSVRPKALYMNGVPREFLKTTKEDFFQKELSNLGQQELYQAELYAENERDVFGYQDRYHEYRSHPSQVSQDFRDTLNAFHLGRELSPDVALNQSFVECDPSRRIFQVTDEQVDTLWCMVNNHLVARRMVPKRANPRIL